LASTVMALGSAHANLWELDSAESAYFRAALLAMDGPESVRLELAHKVAALHLRQGKASEVIGECRHALAAVDRADPSYSTVVADLEHDLALALTELGQLEEAERLYVRLVAATDAQPRRAAPQIVLLLLNYGHLLVDQEKFADAYIVLERALSMAESVLGTEHPNTAYALHSIGALYMRQGAYVLAEEYLRRAIAIWDSLDEGLSPIAAESLHALALLRGHKWDFVEAERLLERALAIQLAALPETDARVLATQEALASVPGRNQSRHGQETEATE
jgi:tetratricopeptide (TPR) repeat protein